MSDLVQRLRVHVNGPAKCPSCGKDANNELEQGCGEPCSFLMGNGTHTDSFDDPWQAKKDMLAAADRIEELESALRIIAEGYGQCAICGKISEEPGWLGCDSRRGYWAPLDVQAFAAKALKPTPTGGIPE